MENIKTILDGVIQTFTENENEKRNNSPILKSWQNQYNQ